MQTVKCPNCRKRTVLPATTCVHCGTDLSDAIRKQTTEAKIRQIRRKYEEEWLRRPNVVSVATRKDADGQYYIAVGVETLEEVADVPEATDGVPVRIEPVGRIYAAKADQIPMSLDSSHL